MSNPQQISSGLVVRLLWPQKRKWQIVWAAVGTFIGLLLLTLSIQCYLDIRQILSNSTSGSEEFIMINKPVNLLNTFGMKSGFSTKEIKELEEQDFFNSVGQFTANQFKVSASSKALGFYTELFLEAVLDRYIDTQSKKWNWETGQIEVPILLSKDYLALYNFGFAPSQGLPQFTEGTIRQVTFDLGISGNDKSQSFQGRIIGFSNRINSIIVPKSFMDWANKEFGKSSEKPASRLIISTNQPDNEQLSQFLSNKGYELSHGRMLGGQLASLLNIVLSGIGLIGLLIFLLSLLIFTLNFRLIIARAKGDIDKLLQLGYRPAFIINILSKHLFKIMLLIGAVTVIFLLSSRFAIGYWLNNKGFELAPTVSWITFLTAVLFSVIFYIVNYKTIQSQFKAR